MDQNFHRIKSIPDFQPEALGQPIKVEENNAFFKAWFLVT